MTYEEFKKKYCNKHGSLLSSWFKFLQKNEDDLKFLLNLYSDKIYENNKKDLQEIVIRFQKNISKFPICPICGKHSKDIFTETCGSQECMRKLRQKRNEENNLQKYGVKNQFQRKEIIEIASGKETREKVRQTFQKKYGVDNASQVEEFKKKRENTIKEKYGVTNGRQIPGMTEKIEKIFQEKYGVSSPFQLPYCREKRKSKESLDKEYETKKRNGTLNSSNAEDYLFEKLKDVFDDAKHGYRSKEYPFNCDFYIPSKDLYIEYQGFWTHGDHPFNPENNEDIEILNNFKIKSEQSKFYKIAVDVWSVKDPTKRKYVQENNLNWIEFFNEKDFLNWLEKQKELIK